MIDQTPTASEKKRNQQKNLSPRDNQRICMGISMLADDLEKQAKKLSDRGMNTESRSLIKETRYLVLQLRQEFGAVDENKKAATMQNEVDDENQMTIDEEARARAGDDKSKGKSAKSKTSKKKSPGNRKTSRSKAGK